MGETDAGIRHQAVKYYFYMREFLNFIMKEEYLSSAVEFVFYDTFYLLFFEEDYLRLNRNPVRRRSVDDTEIPCAEQRKLKGTGNRCCREGKSIYSSAHLS